MRPRKLKKALKERVPSAIWKDVRLVNTFSCDVPWEVMEGDDRSRICHECDSRVHNLLEMTKQEIRLLVDRGDSGFCGQFYLRRDGTVAFGLCKEHRVVRGRLVPVEPDLPMARVVKADDA
jgi:hypothetical protein